MGKRWKMRVAGAGLALLMGGCTTLNYPPPTLGMTEPELMAKSGQPTAKYQDGNDFLLEYMGYWARETYLFRFGPDGRLKSWEQVLTSEKFATVKIGETTRQQVLLTFGQPMQKTYFPRMQQEAWSYRYKQNSMTPALMHIYIDQAGIVRQKQDVHDSGSWGRR